MNRAETALSFKHSGFNCCQSVLLSYEKELGMSRDELIKLGAGFGTGMGTTKATCGALIGAVMVDGILSSRRSPSAARGILTDFENKCGAVTCGDLKGVKTGVELCSCDHCIVNAISAIEN